MFFKNKAVTLDCYTSNVDVFHSAPIKSGIHFYPEWWKTLPVSGSDWKNTSIENGNLTGTNNMKGCVGFTNLHKKSFVIPMWCEWRIVIDKIGNEGCMYQFADLVSEAHAHPHVEHNNHYSAAEYQHLKIHSPWVFICNEPITWSFLPPVWHTLGEFDQVNMMMGVVDFYNQGSTNINMFLKRKEDVSHIEFPFNFPLAYIIPHTEKKVVVKNHLVSSEELSKISAQRGLKRNLFFSNAYHKYMKYKMEGK